MLNLLAYHLDFADKSEEYECSYCIRKLHKIKDEEEEESSLCECDDCYMGSYSFCEEDCMIDLEMEEEELEEQEREKSVWGLTRKETRNRWKPFWKPTPRSEKALYESFLSSLSLKELPKTK